MVLLALIFILTWLWGSWLAFMLWRPAKWEKRPGASQDRPRGIAGTRKTAIYMMARCAPLLGLISKARVSLRDWFNRDKSYRQQALDAPDFEAVWDSFK